MATIGKLVVELTARTSPFTKGMTRAQRGVRGFTRSIGRSIGRVAAFGAALTGVAGAAGVSLLIRRQFELIDATAKMSDRLGTGTEALIGFQHAAGIMGAEQAEANKALELFARRMGEVIDGSGEAVQQFEKLGLNANELAQMDLVDAVGVVADRFNTLGTNAEKAAFAADVFGRSGVKLVNTLSLGSRGLQEMRAEADRLGLTFSRLDAAEIEAANDAIRRMKSTFQGLVARIAIDLAPLVQMLAESFTRTSDGVKRIDDGLGPISTTIAFIVDSVDALRFGILKVAQISSTIFDVMIRQVSAFIGSIANVLDEIPGMGDLANRLQGAANIGSALNVAGRAAIDAELQDLLLKPTFAERLEASRRAIRSMAEAARNSAEPIEDMADGIDEANEALRRQAELMAEGQRVFDRTRTPMEQYESEITRLGELLNAGAIDWDTYGRAVSMAREQLERSTDTGIDLAGAAATESQLTGSFLQRDLSTIAVNGLGDQPASEKPQTQKQGDELISTSDRMERHLETMVTSGIVLRMA